MAAKNKTSNKPKAAAVKSRQLKTSPYRSFRLSKRISHPQKKIIGSFRLFKSSVLYVKKYWKLFLGITFIYALLMLLLVKTSGISLGVADLKTELELLFDGAGSSLLTGVSLFGVLLTTSGSTDTETAGVYQSILIIITSLALIWALRQTQAQEKTSIKESFYKGMYPLIPFLLVLIVICAQLIPLLIGSWLYGVVINGGLAVTAAETVIWVVLIGLLAVLSLYMASSSIFALYIVTLPDMTPFRALRSAREIVRYRRWTVMRKVLALPLVLVVISAVIMVPIIILVTPLAEWVFFGLSMLVLAVVHTYVYKLYRELL